jgi:hypothetical protein
MATGAIVAILAAQAARNAATAASAASAAAPATVDPRAGVTAVVVMLGVICVFAVAVVLLAAYQDWRDGR